MQSEESRLQHYIQGLQNDFHRLLKDTALLNRLMSSRENRDEFDQMLGHSYGLFIYNNDPGSNELVFWNTQLILPTHRILNEDEGEYFDQLPNGWYLTEKKKVQVNGMNDVTVYAMIPVESDFFIETDYLPRSFFYSRQAASRIVISTKPTDYPVRSVSGKTLFYIAKKQMNAVPGHSFFANLCRWLAVLLLLLFIHLISQKIANRNETWKAIVFLTLALFGFRLITYLFPQLLYQRQFELFNPAIYGTNAVQRSLGDLLINSIFVCWIVFFAWAKLKKNKEHGVTDNMPAAWIKGLLSAMLLITATFTLASAVKSLIADSKISFDVTDFFGLSEYTVIGFVVLALLAFSYYYLTQVLFRYIFKLFPHRRAMIYFLISVIGLIYLTLRTNHTEVLFYIPVLCWLLIYTGLAGGEGALVKRINLIIAGRLSRIFIFSVSIAVIMLIENRKVEWEKRKHIAEKLAFRTDPSSERLMSIAIQYLDTNFLRDNFYRFRDADTGTLLRDSIINENYSGYLNKYDTRLYVFDAADHPLHNDDSTTLETLNNILNVQSKPTSVEDLYYYETSYDKFNYVTRRILIDTLGHKTGSFFIISYPKNFSREALFPELFKQFKTADPENSPIYSTAVYLNDRLVSPPGNYPFATSLSGKEIPTEEYTHRINGDFDELWYRYSKEKFVVIARKKETAIETITLFSYIFCTFLFLQALAELISFLIRTRFRLQDFKKLLQLTIRSQVHSTFIFISAISFIIIGIATISFFIKRYNQNNNDKLSRTMKIMVNEMQKKLSERNTFDDVLKIYDTASNSELQRLVNDVSDIHGVDVNVYDLRGNLQVSSEANVYTKGVLSRKMNPAAFYHLNNLRQVQHAQEETIGNFTYLSIYSPVRDEDGKVYAYINIPYFTSKPELRQQISNFLVTVINLNAFVFLIAGMVALYITNRITGSFSLISNKMRQVNLGKMNEEISWNRNDEIGDLVKEYNKMVSKLGESAAMMAKSEREGAWREMARQVAHEIKNPLTPMKLSIQYLQKAIDNNQPNVKELSGNVARTLVEQIDHLSKIAADFSQFANIGNTHVELFDLHEIIFSLQQLFTSAPQVIIQWTPLEEKIILLADKTQMNRLFTNLISNGTQACGPHDSCRIEIGEMKQAGNIRISIRDNGHGIPEELQGKIFLPNFTTKSSGTGLGLAMCKGIVEQARGQIWFETTTGQGSTFYVELPLAPGREST